LLVKKKLIFFSSPLDALLFHYKKERKLWQMIQVSQELWRGKYFLGFVRKFGREENERLWEDRNIG